MSVQFCPDRVRGVQHCPAVFSSIQHRPAVFRCLVVPSCSTVSVGVQLRPDSPSVQPCLILFSSVQPRSVVFNSVPELCHAYSGCTWVFLSGLTYSCWVPSHLVSSLPCSCWACYCAKLLLFPPRLSILYRFFSISVLVRLAIVQWDACFLFLLLHTILILPHTCSGFLCSSAYSGCLFVHVLLLPSVALAELAVNVMRYLFCVCCCF